VHGRSLGRDGGVGFVLLADCEEADGFLFAASFSSKAFVSKVLSLQRCEFHQLSSWAVWCLGLHLVLLCPRANSCKLLYFLVQILRVEFSREMGDTKGGGTKGSGLRQSR